MSRFILRLYFYYWLFQKRFFPKHYEKELNRIHESMKDLGGDK